MANITYEELPVSAQKKYNDKAKARTIGMFIGLAITLVITIAMTVSLTPTDGFGLGLLGGIMIGFLIGGTISGVDHISHWFKKVFKQSVLLIILLGIWYIAVFSVLLGVAMMCGWVHMIIDLVKFLTKKPLVTQGDIVRILKQEQVQAEMMLQSYNNAAPSASDKLAELKEMLDSGLITAEEFEAKKQEILSGI